MWGLGPPRAMLGACAQGNYHHLVRAFSERRKGWFSAYNLQGTHDDDDEPEVNKVERERVFAHTGLSFAKNLAQIPIAYLGKGQLKNNLNPTHKFEFRT